MNLPPAIRKLPWVSIAIGLLCGMFTWVFIKQHIVQGMEEWLFDGCFQYRGTRNSATNIVLITLDDVSLDELKKPLLFSSPEIAEVVNLAHKRGTRAIGLDLMVPEGMAGLPAFQRTGEGDANKLGRAIKQAGNVVLSQFQTEVGWIRTLPQWRFKNKTKPEPIDIGFVDLSEDDDFFIRRQLLRKDDDGPVPHFALAIYARSVRSNPEWDSTRLSVGDLPIPLDRDGKLPINWVGPPGAFKVIPFRDALSAARTDGPLKYSLENAIVLIGVNARGQQDYHATPYANNFWRDFLGPNPGLTPGVEIHGHIIATLADRAFLKALPWFSSFSALLLGGLVTSLSFAPLNRIHSTAKFLALSVLLFLVQHFGWKLVCLEAFRRGNWQIAFMPMLTVGGLCFGGNFIVRWLSARRILKATKGSAIGAALEASPGLLDRQGEECIVTVLFSDIRGFTTYSSKHSGREVVTLLNEYFAAVVPLIEAHGGTLNQYMGDGIMVLFGAPVPRRDHAVQAARAAQAIVRCVHANHAKWSAYDFPKFRVGVGIHTGRVIVGTIGSRTRMDYTAIGDVVNSASRIESHNKKWGTEVLVSADTYQLLPPEVRQQLACDPTARSAELDGRAQPIDLHEMHVP